MKEEIQTKIKCPKCGTQLDFSHIKEGIKSRILEKYDLELDDILQKI